MILEKIKNPSDIRKLNLPEQISLAKEVRKRIVDVVSKRGGHIAPSLGAVDLTISLMANFDPLQDRIVFDVGHQAYAWKILTGRNERFETLRGLNGISGFMNRDESPCDAFSTGHSSTSISAALGIACARDLKGERGHAVAVIGDGALTGGMSFEALNHTGHLQPNRFIVILNDNAMSISKNVGGLQKYMAKMMASRSYNSLKKQIWDVSHSLPSSLRRRFIYGAQKLEESMMNILVPNIIFEDLGLKYVGPIDGHDIEQMNSILKRVKRYMVGPVLIHVVTQKGKGYSPAEQNAAQFHGVGPFEPKSGATICSGKESWSEVFGKCLVRMAEKDPDIVAISAAMAAGTGLSEFESVYPDRFFDVGIAEQHAVTLAAGMATKGIKPFVAIYSSFYQRALDQIIHDVALPRLPVVFCIDRAGLVGEDGATHHGAFDISFLQSVPGLTILAPSDASQLCAMLSWASTWKQGPVAIRYPRGAAPCSQEADSPFEPAKARVLHTPGLHTSSCAETSDPGLHTSSCAETSDPGLHTSRVQSHADGDVCDPELALISVGDALPLASAVHYALLEQGIDAWLIDLCSIKPLDLPLLQKLAQSCSHLLSFETNSRIGGIGATLAQELSSSPCEVVSYGYPDAFVPHGKVDELNSLIGFDSPSILADILKRLHK